MQAGEINKSNISQNTHFSTGFLLIFFPYSSYKTSRKKKVKTFPLKEKFSEIRIKQNIGELLILKISGTLFFVSTLKSYLFTT